MDYMQLMNMAFDGMTEALETADSRDGKARESWLKLADQRRADAMAYALANIAQSLAVMAESPKPITIKYTGTN